MGIRNRQQGLSLMAVLFWGAIIAFLFLIGMQVVPSYTEYREIKAATQKAAREGGTVAAIRESFSKQQQAGYISSIAPQDLDITKDASGKVVVSFAYQKKLQLFGPVSLVIDYSGSATGQ
jgi:phosphopantetheinyl transferase (holo-ACP synthase)